MDRNLGLLLLLFAFFSLAACGRGEPLEITLPTPTPAPVNLARTALVSASRALPDQPLAMINDGIWSVPDANFWGSGDFPFQWVEFDLQTTASVERVELLISQSPAGNTVHEILGRTSPEEEWRLLERLTGRTADLETLVVEPEDPWQEIRFLRIETPVSPSWVSWGEVEIWGTPDDGIIPEVAVATATEPLPEGGPDLILVGGTVITVDAEFSIAEALAVDEGQIAAVGSIEAILALRGTDTRVVDLGGATVMPGIVDPHIHMIQHETPDVEAMAAAQQSLIESGRTTVGIPGIAPFNMEGFVSFADRTVIRIHLYIAYNSNCGDRPLPDYWRSFDFGQDPDDRLAVAGVKVFADGGSCNGPAVAWTYPDPLPEGIGFTDWVGKGSLYITADELAGVVLETGERGGQVVVHAAGERAITTALDGMEQALGSGGNPQRHRMDHNDFVPLDQRKRYGELGVIPVVFGDYDSCFEPGGIWSLLAPPEALERLQHNRDLVEANSGLPIAWHADLPFTRIDIFAQLQMLANLAEVTEDGAYCDAPEFLADQGVGVEQAIRMMTWNAAYAMNLEAAIGSLEPGKRADLIIIEANPLELPEDGLFQNAVWATLIDGAVAHCGGPPELCDQFTP